MASSGRGVPTRAADRNPLDEVASPALGKVLVPSNSSSTLPRRRLLRPRATSVASAASSHGCRSQLWRGPYYWEQGVYGKNGRPDIRFVARLLVRGRLVALRVLRQRPVQRLSARRGRAGRVVVSRQLCIGQQAIRRELGRLLRPGTPPLRRNDDDDWEKQLYSEQSSRTHLYAGNSIAHLKVLLQRLRLYLDGLRCHLGEDVVLHRGALLEGCDDGPQLKNHHSNSERESSSIVGPNPTQCR